MYSTVLRKDGDNLKLDASTLQWVGNQSELLAVIDGDSLVLKKRRNLLDFASSIDENHLSLEEVNNEIHESRKES